MVNKDTFKGVQALRGLAALSVMLFHFRWNINIESPGLGDKLFGWGATGVDLFFLISGFVITLSAKKSPVGLEGALVFLKKRALRILPAYYIILLISFLLSGAMSTFHYADKTENLISAFAFYPIYPEHPPFYVDDNGMYGIRWTLNYEVFFYLMVAVSVLFKNQLICLGALLTSTLLFLPLAFGNEFSFNPNGYRFDSAILGLISNPMIFLFVMGVLIGLAQPYLQNIPKKLKISLLIICIAMIIYFFSNGLYVGHGLLSSGWVYSFLLLSFVMAEEEISRFVPNVMIGLGNISFSLYLIHTLMNGGLGKRFSDFGVPDGSLRFTLSVVLSCLLAWFSYKYIERPISFRKKMSARVHS